MILNVYRVAPDDKREMCFKEPYFGHIAECVTGEILGDTLPAILSPKARELYNGMRLMKQGINLPYSDCFWSV